MSLERHHTLPNTWRARYYPHGRRKDPATGKASNNRETVYFEGDEASARAWYVTLLQSNPAKKAPPLAPTIDQAYTDFCVHYRNEVSERTYKDFLLTYERHLKNFFGSFRPAMLTPAIFDAYKNKRSLETYLPGKRGQKPDQDTPADKAKRKPVTRRTVQKEITYIQSMLKWMITNNKCLPLAFKINNYKASQTEAPAKIIPTRREMILLIRACRGERDRKYRHMLAVAYYSGLRRSELFNLDGSKIDLQTGYMRVKGKGDKTRTVPIVTRLKPYLRKAHKRGRLFSNPETGNVWDNLDKLLIRVCKAVGIQTISLHTFRHAFAVHALMRGTSLRTLQLVMGHSSIKTTEKYLHLVPADLTLDLDPLAKRTAPTRNRNK